MSTQRPQQDAQHDDPLDLCRQDIGRVDATLVALLQERKRLAQMFERLIDETRTAPAAVRDAEPR